MNKIIAFILIAIIVFGCAQQSIKASQNQISAHANENESVVENQFGVPIAPMLGSHCPTGFTKIPEGCLPLGDTQFYPIIKSKGNCPPGYREDGSSGYCYHYDKSFKKAFQKRGNNCPKDYKSDPSGYYCIAKSQ